MGDFGVGGRKERATGLAMKRFEQRYPAQLLVTLGDNDYTDDPASFRRYWRASFGWLRSAGVSVAGTLGNHDVEVQGGRYEFSALGMPRAYYTRRVGKVQLFLLNSNSLGTTQTRWLRRALAASTARWKIAVFHHPPYTCGGHGGSESVEERWVPLFERYGVQLVLSGHDHNYQRFARRRGVVYVVHGGGGAPLYALRACPSDYPRRVFARSVRGFLSVVAARGRLRVSAITLSGRVLNRVYLYP